MPREQKWGTSATHVALLPSLALGDKRDLEITGAGSWKEIWTLGPSETCFLAFCGNLWFPVPRWGWAADSLSVDIPNLRASRPKPASPQPLVGNRTGFARRRGDTQTRFAPGRASPARDSLHLPWGKGAMPSEIGGGRFVGLTPIKRCRFQRSFAAVALP